MLYSVGSLFISKSECCYKYSDDTVFGFHFSAISGDAVAYFCFFGACQTIFTLRIFYLADAGLPANPIYYKVNLDFVGRCRASPRETFCADCVQVQSVKNLPHMAQAYPFKCKSVPSVLFWCVYGMLPQHSVGSFLLAWLPEFNFSRSDISLRVSPDLFSDSKAMISMYWSGWR